MTPKTPYRHPAEYRGALWRPSSVLCSTCDNSPTILLTPATQKIVALRCETCDWEHRISTSSSPSPLTEIEL